MEAWKVNLISVWLGCFFTGLAMSQILPFLPLYVEQLGVSDPQSLSLWSGLVFSGTFLVSAVVSPLWGSLADRKGRKLMLLRASLGMAIVIALQGLATNVWQLFALRALMGLTSGYIPNAMALVASQAPRDKSGWALGTHRADLRRDRRAALGRADGRSSGAAGGVFRHRRADVRQLPGDAVPD